MNTTRRHYFWYEKRLNMLPNFLPIGDKSGKNLRED
jgi:hypothetical protein